MSVENGHSVVLYEETTRGTVPGSPVYKAAPATGKLKPKVTYKDEARVEARGQSAALGNSTVVRKDATWAHTLETAWYPTDYIALLFKHLFGYASAGTVTDVTAFTRLFYSIANPYGAGNPLGSSAIAYTLNEEVNGTVLSQLFGAGRIKACKIHIKGTDDIKITFDFTGDGNFVGLPGQTAVTGFTEPAIEPFVSSAVHAQFYIGAGATLTGTAPDYTAIAPGTMQQFIPDDCTITITNGLTDKRPIGPMKSTRSAAVKVEIDFTMDYEDPATGFSSRTQFDSIFSGVTEAKLMIVLNNGQLAGSTTANYGSTLYMPLGLYTADSPDIETTGKTPSLKSKVTSLVDPAVGKPIFLQTVDKVTAA